MSDQELYEIARQRIDSRNRRWMWWSIHLAGLVAYVGLFILLADSVYSQIAVAVLVAWGGLFAMHSILLGMAESRTNDIQGEIAKLREQVYEKPKRLQLAEDGELVEAETQNEVYRAISR